MYLGGIYPCYFYGRYIPGIFYTQFGITMATSVGLSCICALTLCPALCAMMMRPASGTKSAKSINGRVRAAYNASYNAMLGKYKKGVMFFIHHRWMVWTSLVCCIALLVYLMSTPKPVWFSGRSGSYDGECQCGTG